MVIAGSGGVAWEAGLDEGDSPGLDVGQKREGRALGACALPDLGRAWEKGCVPCLASSKVVSSPEGCPGELDPNPGQRAQAGIFCSQL